MHGLFARTILMKQNSYYLLFFFFSIFNKTWSQGAYSPLDDIQLHALERFEIKNGKLSNDFHTNIKPFERQELANFTTKLDTAFYRKLSKSDRFNLNYLQADNWEFLNQSFFTSNLRKKPVFKYLYKNKSDLYFVDDDDFDIHVSPILNLSYGYNSQIGDLESKPLFINTRGVEIRGRINKKLGFYTMVTENQASSPNFVVNFFETYQGIPYQSFVKVKYEDFTKLQVDYFNAIGYIAFKPIKNLNLMFGHDKNFIGSGIRSMVLSNFSSPYLQLKANLKIGRFQYLSILGQMTNLQVPNSGNSSVTFPPKYLAFHHLNVNISKRLNVGLFESVMYGKRDYGFEFNYLNPLIFYRFIEGYLGSTDNALVGADFKLNLFKSVSTYGQFFLDEYNSEEFKKKGWWSKKYAWQLGGKYVDIFKIKNLDLQIEVNRARPFMYSHFTTYSNYVNYNLPIAHPLGANFKEMLFVLRYQPVPIVFITLTKMRARKGEDINTINFGGNIKLDNKIGRLSDYDNFLGQGFKNTINSFEFLTSIMLKHNFFLDFSFQQRNDSFVVLQNEKIIKLGIRWNFFRNSLLF